ncbi:S8 family serine peptidase [Jatrophihabitans sp.]|uniref:S8 family serine peptidase n=1 Tax=Jatrophihabitans sp. TaxID=1932789 RepID=UPI002EFF7A4F
MSDPTPTQSNDSAGPWRLEDQPELVVVVSPDAVLPAATGAARAQLMRGLLAPDAPSPIADLLSEVGADVSLRPVAGRRATATLMASVDDDAVTALSSYFVVQGVTAGHEELAQRLREIDSVHGAYVKPPAELPVALNDMAPAADDPPTESPDFSGRQGYLEAPPGGVGALWAHAQPGGRGKGVNVIDIEGSWRLTHEDLVGHLGGLMGGTPSEDLGWRNHGTAVVGVIGSAANRFGTLGIAPEAFIRTISIFGAGSSSAAAIRQAADALSAGDILLIELQRRGPMGGMFGQGGYIAVEWWPDDFDAIAYAVSRGVIVVEAAGNGSQNLDDPTYDTPQTGFPAGWKNPLGGGRDSGAVLVGAGAPPPGVHGTSSWGPDRSRLDFSNYGSRVDVQGWGREVTSCGYGDLQGGTDHEDAWYTDKFSGTSSASPIVVGALACAQGILRAAATPLTPATARRLLRETGSPQQAGSGGDVSQNIGSRPDIAALVRRARDTSHGGKHDKEGKEGKESKEGKENKENKETEGPGPIKYPKLEKNEFKDAVDKHGEHGPAADDPPQDPTLEDRVGALEAEVEHLRHFISPELRPDLTGAARQVTHSSPDNPGAGPAADPSAQPGQEPAQESTPTQPRKSSGRTGKAQGSASPAKAEPAKRTSSGRSRGRAEEA